MPDGGIRQSEFVGSAYGMEKEEGDKVKVIIYQSDIAEATIIFDTQAKEMRLESPVLGTKVAPTPKDSIGGAYLAGELAQAWLNNEEIVGMTGEWVHGENNKHINAVRAWLEGE